MAGKCTVPDDIQGLMLTHLLDGNYIASFEEKVQREGGSFYTLDQRVSVFTLAQRMYIVAQRKVLTKPGVRLYHDFIYLNR